MHQTQRKVLSWCHFDFKLSFLLWFFVWASLISPWVCFCFCDSLVCVISSSLYCFINFLPFSVAAAKHLDLYQVLAPNAYSYREEFIPVIKRAVQSQVHEVKCHNVLLLLSSFCAWCGLFSLTLMASLFLFVCGYAANFLLLLFSK